MKSLASAAKTSENTADLSDQFDEIRDQIAAMADDSGYGGQNLLNNDSLSVEFNEDGSNTLSVAGTMATGVGTVAGKAIDASDFSTNTAIETSITQIDDAVTQLRTEAQKLASNLSTIQISRRFHDSDGKHPEHRCGQPDAGRHERRRRQHADATDAPVPGYDILVHVIPGCAGRAAALLMHAI